METLTAALYKMGSDMARWKGKKCSHFHSDSKNANPLLFFSFKVHNRIANRQMRTFFFFLQVTAMWYLLFSLCSSGKWSAMNTASIPQELTMETATCSLTGSVFTIMRPQVSGAYMNNITYTFFQLYHLIMKCKIRHASFLMSSVMHGFSHIKSAV